MRADLHLTFNRPRDSKGRVFMSYGSSMSSDNPTRTYGTSGTDLSGSSGGTSSSAGMSDTGMASSMQDMAGQAKSTASQMTHQLKEQANTKLNDQKGQAAQGLGSVASAMTQLSDQLRAQSPSIADFADTAAVKIERFSNQIEQRDVTELLSEVERFARRQPLAFLGGAFALGLLGARFLKSSNPDRFRGYPSANMSNYRYAESSSYPGYPGYSDYSRASGYRSSGGYPSSTAYSSFGARGSSYGSLDSTGTMSSSDTYSSTDDRASSMGGSQQTHSPYVDASSARDMTDRPDSTSRTGVEG